MQVESLDQVNIATPDVAATARWYADVLGLDSRAPNASVPPERALWLLDAAGRAIIHLQKLSDRAGPTGPVHHVALRCRGHTEVIARLQQLGMEHQSAFVEQLGRYYVVLRDPHGVVLELNFDER